MTPAATWELVAAAQRGDMRAYGELYESYVDDVFRFILCRTGDRVLTEDLTSETFLRGLRRIDSLHPRAGHSPAAWFVTIARNLILDHVKSSRHRYDRPCGDLEPAMEQQSHANPRTDRSRFEDAVWLNITPQRSPEDVVVEDLAAAELRAVLWRCVNQLKPGQREVIILHYLTGLTIADTAAVLHRNENATKSLQHRAVRKLATMFPDGQRW